MAGFNGSIFFNAVECLTLKCSFFCISGDQKLKETNTSSIPGAMNAISRSPQKPFTCDQCGMSFKLVTILKMHMRKHSDEKPHVCEKCDKRFKFKANLLRHVVHVHSKTPVSPKQRRQRGMDLKKPRQCDKCRKVFNFPYLLKAHKCTSGQFTVDALRTSLESSSPTKRLVVRLENDAEKLLNSSKSANPGSLAERTSSDSDNNCDGNVATSEAGGRNRWKGSDRGDAGSDIIVDGAVSNSFEEFYSSEIGQQQRTEEALPYSAGQLQYSGLFSERSRGSKELNWSAAACKGALAVHATSCTCVRSCSSGKVTALQTSSLHPADRQT